MNGLSIEIESATKCFTDNGIDHIAHDCPFPWINSVYTTLSVAAMEIDTSYLDCPSDWGYYVR